MTNTPFTPIRKRQTIQDLVYEQMREALMSGAFEAGEGFTISALSEKFSTSHMPVREAIRRLVAENALVVSSSGTAVVPQLDLRELMCIRDVRLLLEPATAERAFEHFGKPEIERLRALVSEHQLRGERNEVVAMLAANREFHFTIYAAAQNPVLVSQIENLWLRSGAYVRYLSDRMGPILQNADQMMFVGHHKEMIAALESGDRAGFATAMASDISDTHALLAKALTE
ncbi:GntR family transcriptional regulator [Sulfitobacter sp. LCG007]